MADEAQVRASLNIKIGNLDYRSNPTAFNATVLNGKGPAPGAVTIAVGGTLIDLSQFVTPGFYRLMNLDITNYVQYGIWDPQTHLFYPWGEIGPGEFYIGKFSRNLCEEYTGTGTGTSAPTNRVMLKADHADCVCLLEIFEA